MWSSDSASSNDSGQLSREGSVRSADAEGGRFPKGALGRSNDGEVSTTSRGGSGLDINGDLGQFSQGNSARSNEADQGPPIGRRLDTEISAAAFQSPKRLSGDSGLTPKAPESPLQKRSQSAIPGTPQFAAGAKVLVIFVLK